MGYEPQGEASTLRRNVRAQSDRTVYISHVPQEFGGNVCQRGCAAMRKSSEPFGLFVSLAVGRRGRDA